MLTGDPEKIIQEAVNRELQKLLKPIARELELEARIIIKNILLNSSLFFALTEGELLGHFGFPRYRAKEIVAKVFTNIANSVYIKVVNTSIEVSIIKSDFSDIPKGGQSFQTKKKTEIKWFDWLVFQGNKTIIQDYHYMPKMGKGRSQEGVMVKKGFWRVPARWAGTENDNAITRLINEAEKQISEYITKSLEEKVRKI